MVDEQRHGCGPVLRDGRTAVLLYLPQEQRPREAIQSAKLLDTSLHEDGPFHGNAATL